jgi:hypothetical protein
MTVLRKRSAAALPTNFFHAILCQIASTRFTAERTNTLSIRERMTRMSHRTYSLPPVGTGLRTVFLSFESASAGVLLPC